MPTSQESLAKTFEELVGRAVRHLSPDMVRAVESAAERTDDETASGVLGTILERAHDAKAKGRGLTADTGLITFFVRVGCSFPGLTNVEPALRDAVAAATKHEPLAPHATDVLTGKVQKDNLGRGLPVVHVDLVPGVADCHVTVLLKGAASDAMSALWMLPPDTTMEAIGDRIASHIGEGGGRPCPPLVVGVGLGGTPEHAMMLSRKALLRPVGEPATDEALRGYERAWATAIDATGIGPMGLGGSPTALAVHAECADRHTAIYPVAVSVGCWTDRRASVSIDGSGGVHW